jgi:hypothetical protein
MTNLPRIRIIEPSGLRRFLYPLPTEIALPEGSDPAKIALRKADGSAVPLQLVHAGRRTSLSGDAEETYRVDFAVSLAPHETIELNFTDGAPEIVPDPLRVTIAGGALISKQQRLRLEIGRDALPLSMVYDGTQHLRAPIRIERNGLTSTIASCSNGPDATATIAAWATATGSYPDGVASITRTEITACKSWVIVTHEIGEMQAGDTITFTLPFAVVAERLVADFGTGNGTYAHISAEPDRDIVWHAEQSEAGWSWRLAVSGRLDYSASLLPHELASRNWLHVIDGDKSVAIAVLSPLEGLASLETRIAGNGEIATTFRTDASARGKRTFAVCYHFLNALPPIAAATNPHSILEPPVVELVLG